MKRTEKFKLPYSNSRPAHPTEIVDGIAWKVCNRCLQNKPAEENFSHKSQYNPEYQSRCRSCIRIVNREQRGLRS